MTLAHVLCARHFGCAVRAINNQIVTTTNDFAPQGNALGMERACSRAGVGE
jgi:hypothetical protein